MVNKVSFYVQADQATGLGHMKRCRVLQAMLEQRGVRTRCFNCSSNAAFSSGFDGNILSFAHMKSHCVVEQPDVIVVDMPVDAIDASDLGSIRQSGIKVVIIDDSHFYKGKESYDVLVACSAHFQHAPADERHCFGLDYVIIDPAVGRADLRTPSVGHSVKQLLLSFGGTDPEAIGLRMLECLRRLGDNNLQTLLIKGKADYEVPSFYIDQLRGAVSVLDFVDDLPARLAQADIAFISGGMTMYEACFLGVPSVIVSQNEEQQQEAEQLAGLGAVINLGLGENLAYEQVEQVIRQCQAFELRSSLSRKGASLIDGRGAGRIADRILMERGPYV